MPPARSKKLGFGAEPGPSPAVGHSAVCARCRKNTQSLKFRDHTCLPRGPKSSVSAPNPAQVQQWDTYLFLNFLRPIFFFARFARILSRSSPHLCAGRRRPVAVCVVYSLMELSIWCHVIAICYFRVSRRSVECLYGRWLLVF